MTSALHTVDHASADILVALKLTFLRIPQAASQDIAQHLAERVNALVHPGRVLGKSRKAKIEA